MNYIIIDDNEDFAKELKTKLGIKAVHTENSIQNVDKLAKKINKINKLNETDCLCINSEVLINENSKRIDYSGIELLKILRIKHRFLKPIIVYGFTALDNLLQHYPEHLILTAKGNKYLQLPLTNQNIEQQAEILKPITEDSLVKSYRNVLSSDANIRDISHSFANEYGLELMCRAHQGVTNQILNISGDDKGQLKSLMAKAEFLYDYEKNTNLRQESMSLRKKLINHITTNTSKILCIDDQGTNNWFTFYKNLLNCSDVDNCFKGFTPNEDFDKAKKQIINCIQNFKPDLVLLDLRLYGDNEEGKKIREISGFQVLEEIKQKYPALPVVITSATNKSDNLTALLKAKAFGLWSKPRIEQGNIDIYEKYHSLLEIIYEALTFYEFEDEKIPIKTDYLINQIESENINEELKQYLNNYDLIITDTNCWMQGVRAQSGVDKIAKLNKNLYLTSKIVGSNFLIIDDVKRELSEHLHKISEIEEKKIQYKKNSVRAKYGIELLNKIITEESIFVYDFHLLHYNIGHRFKFWYKKNDETSINEYYSFKDTRGKKGNDGNYTKDDKKKFSRMFYEGLDTNPNSKLNCDNIIKKLNKRTKVHADPYFVNIIFNFLITNNDKYKKRNILFITEDIDCADQVYFYIKKSLGYEDEQIKSTKEKHNIEKVVSGIFNGKIDDEVFSLTIKNPFKFSKKIEKLINEN